jgi:hypothetical protein
MAQPQQPAPVDFKSLTSGSSASDIGSAYGAWANANGGDNPMNRSIAGKNLQGIGVGDETINGGLQSYLTPKPPLASSAPSQPGMGGK